MNYYLFAAYSLVWTALFIYMFALHRRQNLVEQKLRDMSRKDSR